MSNICRPLDKFLNPSSKCIFTILFFLFPSHLSSTEKFSIYFYLSLSYPKTLISSSQPIYKWHSGGRNPTSSFQETLHGKPLCLHRTRHHMVSRPLHPPFRISPITSVHKLPIINRPETEISGPREPPGWFNQTVHIALHYHRPRIRFPWPPQISSVQTLHRLQIRRRSDYRIVDHEPGILIRVGPRLGRDGVFLVQHRLSHEDVTILKNDDTVAENEVDGSVNVTFTVKLAVGVGV